MNPTALDILCSRGPWYIRVLYKPTQTLTAAELRAYFTAIANGAPDPAGTTLACSQSEGKASRASQLLRRAGLIEFGGRPPRRWVLTSLGRQVHGR